MRTWDGLPIADEEPHGASVAVRRIRGETPEFLVLHRNVNGPDYEGDWAWTSPAGARQPGEPVYRAVLRELTEETGITAADVWAVDLSGRWAVFAADVADDAVVDLIDPEHDRYEWLEAPAARARILPSYVAETQVDRVVAIPRVSLGFRPMSRADLPDVVRWTTAPHVARWWDQESTDLGAAERHYGPAIDGSNPTRMWVLEVNGRSVGFVQDYLIGDHPECALLTARPDAVGFDYAIGDPAWIARGVGTRMLWTFLRDVVRPHYPHAKQFFASPDHRNAASLRVLDKLGFARGTWFDEPQRNGRVDTLVGCCLDVPRVFG
ncbi:MAG TPA: GNAT family N-acetyltransferase [Nocardioidaceae bacterium]|nr:GNAT family N-acetyltransferase [Nocardioidaceae bacterium]